LAIRLEGVRKFKYALLATRLLLGQTELINQNAQAIANAFTWLPEFANRHRNEVDRIVGEFSEESLITVLPSLLL
jgi:hypothetical protein